MKSPAGNWLKACLVPVTGFLLLHGAGAQDEADEEKAPPPVPSVLVWERAEIEFDAKLGDESCEVVYTAKNTGRKRVRLTSVRSTCACVSAEAPVREVAPGDEVDVKVVFTFGERVGGQSLITYVKTDEEGVAPTRLRLKGTIPAVIRFSERLLLWEVGEEPTPRTIAAEIHPEADLTVREVTCDSEAFTVSVVPDKEDPKRFDLIITPAATAEPAKARIEMQTAPPLAENRQPYYRIMAYVR